MSGTERGKPLRDFIEAAKAAFQEFLRITKRAFEWLASVFKKSREKPSKGSVHEFYGKGQPYSKGIFMYYAANPGLIYRRRRKPP